MAASLLAWAAAAGSPVPLEGSVRGAAAAPAACASLASLALPETVIALAAEVAGPNFAPPNGAAIEGLPPFCRVVGTTKPALNFEVWLPLENWNGKYQGVGNGANAGSIVYPAMATALKRGYATASTDTGHATRNARDAQWAVGHPELLVDFGYRAIHVTAEHAKRVVAAFYGKPAERAYFMSCSTGGRQALMEAQRFPEDYDGIVAGAPAANWSRFQTGGHLWVALALNKDPESYLPPGKLKLLGDAVNASCDGLDGINDGVLDDPRKCSFDPEALVCKAGQDAGECLTLKQARAVKDIWTGARTSTGQQVYPPYARGAEAAGGWNAYMTGTGPLTGNHWEQADNVLRYMVFENPQWDFRTFDFDRDVDFTITKLGKTFDAFDPNLSAFRARGGKLLMYHGWNDPSISPLNTINYYESLVAAMQGAGAPAGTSRGAGASAAATGTQMEAEAATQEFARLFMVPGMLHCSGGPGPSAFDMLGALENWVEKGQAPERVVASRTTKGVVDRTRPLCVYPKVAVYRGSGSTDAAESFVCRLPNDGVATK
jgi:feruloyl esterase